MLTMYSLFLKQVEGPPVLYTYTCFRGLAVKQALGFELFLIEGYVKLEVDFVPCRIAGGICK